MAKITINEIAQLAGVSIGTVSRALNGRSGVSPETRASVLEIVKQTGFVPDVGARRLARGTQQLIGVAPFSENATRSPYYAFLLDAIQESLYQRGFVARVLDPRDATTTHECAGFIVPGIHFDDPRIPSLRRRNIPVVVVGSVDDNTTPWVDIDNIGGMKAAVEHLIKLGHKRIAHMTGTPIGQTTEYRLEAYQTALMATGLVFDQNLVLDGGFTDLGGYRAVHQFVHGLNELPFTAIAAASDEMAAGAILALQDLGLRVPRDVSVTGFDDLPFARHLTPSLTTVRQPIREVGHHAAELLLEQLEGHPPRTITVPTELMARASSGPAPEREPSSAGLEATRLARAPR